MTRTLINVVVWSHWGRAWSTRSQEIASSFQARLQWRAGDQGENLFVGCQTVLHCTAVLYSDSSLTAATQLGPAEPAAASSEWQGDTAVHCRPLIGQQAIINTFHWLIGIFLNWMKIWTILKATKTGSNFRKMSHGKWMAVSLNVSDKWNDVSFRKHHWQIVYAYKHEQIEELLKISMINIHWIWSWIDEF